MPTEPTAAIAGEPSPDDSTDSERDEASEEEIHDVALAVETSSYSPQGHEVTSPPSENDQGEGIRIVTEAVEQTAPKRGSGAPTSTSRADRAAESTAAGPGTILDEELRPLAGRRVSRRSGARRLSTCYGLVLRIGRFGSQLAGRPCILEGSWDSTAEYRGPDSRDQNTKSGGIARERFV